MVNRIGHGFSFWFFVRRLHLSCQMYVAYGVHILLVLGSLLTMESVFGRFSFRFQVSSLWYIFVLLNAREVYHIGCTFSVSLAVIVSLQSQPTILLLKIICIVISYKCSYRLQSATTCLHNIGVNVTSFFVLIVFLLLEIVIVEVLIPHTM